MHIDVCMKFSYSHADARETIAWISTIHASSNLASTPDDDDKALWTRGRDIWVSSRLHHRSVEQMRKTSYKVSVYWAKSDCPIYHSRTNANFLSIRRSTPTTNAPFNHRVPLSEIPSRGNMPKPSTKVVVTAAEILHRIWFH